MDRRITVALVVVFVLFLGLAWWLQRPQSAPKADTGSVTPTAAPLWTVAQATITEINIKDQKANITVDLQKDSQGNWLVMGLPAQPADTNSVTAVLGRIASMNVLSDLGENLNPTDYGFSVPAIFTVTTTDKKTYVLEIGDKTPIQNGYYVRLSNTKRIYIVATYSLSSIMDWIANPPLPATPTPTETVTPAASATSTAGSGTPDATPAAETPTLAATSTP